MRPRAVGSSRRSFLSELTLRPPKRQELIGRLEHLSLMDSPPDDQALDDYLREIAKTPRLSKAEEAELLSYVQTHRPSLESAEKRLIESYLHLVVLISERYLSPDLSRLEIYQEGNVGLFYAVRHFSGPAEDFAAYAVSRIVAAIERAIADIRRSPTRSTSS
jgi:DNA-directed RNA polymerase sigma subunit (sigma70/sigma32)